MRRKDPARTEALRLHQAAVDRLIFLAVKRREAERELREYAGQDFVFGKTVPHRG